MFLNLLKTVLLYFLFLYVIMGRAGRIVDRFVAHVRGLRLLCCFLFSPVVP